MHDQHRAFLNDDFMFYASQIGSDKLEVYKHLMKSEVEQQNTEIDSKHFNGKVTITKLGDEIDQKSMDMDTHEVNEQEKLLQESFSSGTEYYNFLGDKLSPELENDQLEYSKEINTLLQNLKTIQLRASIFQMMKTT